MIGSRAPERANVPTSFRLNVSKSRIASVFESFPSALSPYRSYISASASGNSARGTPLFDLFEKHVDSIATPSQPDLELVNTRREERRQHLEAQTMPVNWLPAAPSYRKTSGEQMIKLSPDDVVWANIGTHSEPTPRMPARPAYDASGIVISTFPVNDDALWLNKLGTRLCHTANRNAYFMSLLPNVGVYWMDTVPVARNAAIAPDNCSQIEQQLFLLSIQLALSFRPKWLWVQQLTFNKQLILAPYRRRI